MDSPLVCYLWLAWITCLSSSATSDRPIETRRAAPCNTHACSAQTEQGQARHHLRERGLITPFEKAHTLFVVWLTLTVVVVSPDTWVRIGSSSLRSTTPFVSLHYRFVLRLKPRRIHLIKRHGSGGSAMLSRIRILSRRLHSFWHCTSSCANFCTPVVLVPDTGWPAICAAQAQPGQSLRVIARRDRPPMPAEPLPKVH